MTMNMNAFTLAGKVALITGGGSGIGRASAIALAQAGAFVWLVNRSESSDVVAEIKRAGGKAACLSADVTDTDALDNIVDAIYAQSGQIDILINAAGINPRLPAEEMTLDVWEHTIKLNLTIPYYLSHKLAPNMQKNQWGRIINIASLQSFRAFDNSIPYGASKGGVVQLTRALAQAYSKDGVLVNAIAPGFFHTKLTQPVFDDPAKAQAMADQTMMARNGTDDDLFGIIVFLSSSANSYITGQTIALDGGFSAK